ncbi:hypothetical protein D3C74_348280 [compost metagenome]
MTAANRLFTQGHGVHRSGLQMPACNGRCLQILAADAISGQQTVLLQIGGQVTRIHSFGRKMVRIDHGLPEVPGPNAAFSQMLAFYRAFGQVPALHGRIRQVAIIHGAALQMAAADCLLTQRYGVNCSNLQMPVGNGCRL